MSSPSTLERSKEDPIRKLFISPSAQSRTGALSAWLAERPANQPLLVLAPNRLAADDLLRDAALQKGALFAWHRQTLAQLAARIAETSLAREGLAIAGPLSIEALVTRLIHLRRAAGSLRRFKDVTDGPGFAQAIARTLTELRMARLTAADTREVDEELSTIYQAYELALQEASLADRAMVYQVAIAEIEEIEEIAGITATPIGDGTATGRPGSSTPPWIGLPTAILDPDLSTTLDRDLLAAVIERAGSTLLVCPKGDSRARELAERLRMSTEEEVPTSTEGVPRLQRELFADAAAEEVDPCDDVRILSAPGEGRECVEIARRILALADDGVPFDRIAVLTRATEVYRVHLDEAFSRAGIDAWFAKGARLPHPAGRALLALLACKSEGLSANRFAEYLSLSELPAPGADGAPPPPDVSRFVPPDDDMARATTVDEPQPPGLREESAEPKDDPSDGAARPAMRAPRHWERLIVDAAVIGGVERWRRRLDGLANGLEMDRTYALSRGDSDTSRCDRDLAAIESLRDFALPLLEDLEQAPMEGTWGDWLPFLVRLTTRAIRRPDRVLEVLAELRPLHDVGPVSLDEVRRVLSRRLLEIPVPPPKSRAGMVFVGPIDAARGLSFDGVFIPGLAERLFPGQIHEDPILLDRARSALSPELETNLGRVERERQLMRLACGAAARKVFLSYPRLDTGHARPRVPSVYALEALRATEGRLPGFDALSRRAETEADARIGWPAPERREEAIDEAEFDLAVLKALTPSSKSVDGATGVAGAESAKGAARYLLSANPHLTRALRFRARRWLNKWTSADGLVRPSSAAITAMKRHQLGARPFSPTALQHFSACPYRFYLQAIWRLSPRETPEAVEEMNPLQRGSMVHDTQFELFGILRDRDLLPVTARDLPQALAVLDEVLDGVAPSDPQSPDRRRGIKQRYADELAPAIPRVFEDGVSSVKADLREWLRRMSLDDSGFVPWRFELSFGLQDRRDADPSSVLDPVKLDCGLSLRGSIDLVERHPDGRVRVTDHKTGRVRVKPEDRVAGGESLQAVLYPLALEKLLPGTDVDSGRLHYCTTAGGFLQHEVPLDEAARDAASSIADVVGKALAEPFLPAAPNERACDYCDYRVVCGPYEQQRTAQKPRQVLGLLNSVRRMR